MSIYSSYYLVDWPKFCERYAAAGNTDFIQDALEDEESWLIEPNVWDIGASESYTNWRRLQEFSEFYFVLRSHILTELDRPLSQFLIGVGGLMTDNYAFAPIQTLPIESDPWVIGTLSPESIAELLTLEEGIDLFAIAEVFDTTLAESPDCWMRYFGDFCDYIDGWVDLLEEAHSEEKGLLIGAA